MSQIPNFGPIDSHGASAPLNSEIRAITYSDKTSSESLAPTTYPNLIQNTFLPITPLESPPLLLSHYFPHSSNSLP